MKLSFAKTLHNSLVLAFVLANFGGLQMLAADESPSARKPLLVLIFDQKCKVWCSQTRPVVADLQKKYGEQVEFAEIDVTSAVLPEAKKKAKALRIGSLLPDVKPYVPIVLVCAPNRKDYTELMGPKSKEVYEDCLQKILAKRG